MGCASGAVKQEVDVPVTAIFDSKGYEAYWYAWDRGRWVWPQCWCNQCKDEGDSPQVNLHYFRLLQCKFWPSGSFVSTSGSHPPSQPCYHTSHRDVFVLVFTLPLKSVSYPSFICYLYINVFSMWFNKHAVKLHMAAALLFY